jgi:aminobenzoyl-glutamate utilization protein B
VLNTETLAKYREQMKKYYFDRSKYKNYLEQLGIAYPTVHPCGKPATDN